MYTPASFRASEDAAREFVGRHGFGLLITAAGGDIETTHTPMFFSDDGGFLLGHLARANPQWRNWSAGCTARAVFNGPHAYVSPGDYASDFNVPTWNYTSVVIDGRVELVSDHDECLAVLGRLVDLYESGRESPWELDTRDERLQSLLDQIVGFRVVVESVVGKFKLNQNKSDADRERVAERLCERGDVESAAVADLMDVSSDRSDDAT